MDSSDSEELFPIDHQQFNDNSVFLYTDPLLVSGILAAVVNENLDEIKRLVDSGRSVNINDNNGNTPLHVAVIKNNLPVLDYLLSHEEIIVNIRNFRGETPLFTAVKHRNFNPAKRLLQAGANVNLPNHEDVSPLHAAITQPAICQLLIENGADVNATDYSGDSPLHDAVAEDCLETVCMLLYFKADANAPGGNELTPFIKSLISENIACQQALFDYVVDFNAKTADGMSTLALALTHDTPYVAEIINRGADVNVLHNEQVHSYILCLRTNSYENFALIWSKLQTPVNMTELFDYLVADNLEMFINAVIESENLDIAMNSFTKRSNLFMFIDKFSEFQLNPDQLTRLVCRLLCAGYELTVYDIYSVFIEYGYSELLKIFLYTGPDHYTWMPWMIGTRLIFDFCSDVSEIINKKVIYYRDSIERGFEYSVNPAALSAFIEEYSWQELSPKILKLPKVPLLKELARNKTRKHIADTLRCETTSQFYTVVNCLDIPNFCKNLLNFETKLYRVF